MTDLFKDPDNLFQDDEPAQQLNNTASQEQSSEECDGLIERYKRCKAEVNQKLGVIDNSVQIDKETVLNPHKVKPFTVDDDGRVTITKGEMNTTKSQAELMKVIKAKVYKQYGVSGE
ncbi:hypothetical protein [Litorilituus sediminis]|uniref:Uncharacterized protein n=1 Tax=Litorilituus sediminis TaxID=718192 RepID=A0A4P6P4W6_9GAMM|nr:hypothetical protein [Litorilituus sediminis]QBG34382.1 hypothetical protein EMK97_00825 [Litorilituus sediminis]